MNRLIIIPLIILFGCAPIPLRNRLSPYPAQGQDYNQQMIDDQSCTAFAYQAAAANSGSQATVGGTIVGGAAGAASGAIAGALWGSAGNGAAAGAAIGAVFGLLDGLAADAQREDGAKVLAYRNCMVARGYVLP